jgi:hypothetical protein
MVQAILTILAEGLPFLCYWTGEIVSFLLTFGRRKPRWGIPEGPWDTRAYLSGFVGFIVLAPIFFIVAFMLVEAFG